ncbi:MAG: RsmE family RNA methyltransferase [Candidatus Uhrbacteria bacterium]
MRLHRFILDLDLSADELVISDREATNQIRNVFRMEAGDPFIVCDGKGMEATVQVVSDDKTIVAKIIDRRAVDTESATKVTLYCAVLKRENFELVVQKAVECGVAAIIPVISSRTIKLGVKLDRLQKIATEACEQSGRGVVPEIVEPMSLRLAIVHAKSNATNFLFEPGSPDFTGTLVPSGSTGLFIGPEGGWDPAELDLMRAATFTPANLGPRILRAETAAIVATFMATRA